MVLPQQNTSFDVSATNNTLTYLFIFGRMQNIWLDKIIYRDMPDTIDIPTIRRGLFERGHVAYFRDIVMGDLCIAGEESGNLDVYDYPRQYQIHTSSGYYRDLNVSRFARDRDGVIIYDNYSHLRPIDGVFYYADKLYSALRAADVNVELQRKPSIIATTENLRLTLQNILEKADGNQSRVIVDKAMVDNIASIVNVDLSVPYIADKLWTYTTNIWNDFLTWCGIENATNQKRERLVSDEVHANYGNVEMERNSSLDSQTEGFNAVNRLFGTDIKVEFNSHMSTSLNNPLQDISGDLLDRGDE